MLFTVYLGILSSVPQILFIVEHHTLCPPTMNISWVPGVVSHCLSSMIFSWTPQDVSSNDYFYLGTRSCFPPTMISRWAPQVVSSEYDSKLGSTSCVLRI